MVTEFQQQFLSLFVPKLVLEQNLSISYLDLFFWWCVLRVRSHGKHHETHHFGKLFPEHFYANLHPGRLTAGTTNHPWKKGKWSEPNLNVYVQNVNFQECSLNTSPSKSSKSSNFHYLLIAWALTSNPTFTIRNPMGQPVTNVLQTPVIFMSWESRVPPPMPPTPRNTALLRNY